MPKITVNDINLYYESYGSGEPLIFIHGFAVDHLVFASFPEHYQDQYEVILLDSRGSGQSDCPDLPYTIEMMAEDVAAFCRQLNLDACHFAGHSMGGMIVQQIMRRHPELVHSAALCNTDTKIDIRYALTARARLEFIAKKCSPRALVESGLGWTFSADYLSQPGIIEKLIQMRLSNPYPITETGYKNQLNALLTFDSGAWIKELKSPCLVLTSDQDIITSAARAQEIANTIPKADYQCIPGAAHAPFFEKPKAFHQTLKTFLKGFYTGKTPINS